jgi:hypothetical protein
MRRLQCEALSPAYVVSNRKSRFLLGIYSEFQLRRMFADWLN